MKNNSTNRLPRPRIQRAFVRWFNENRTRFEVPIRLTKITAKGIELHFNYFPECLSVWLSSDGLGIHVEWEGQDWDALFDMDIYLCHTPDGYKCKLCVPDEGETFALFPSREALWQDHLFEPFLKWVNEKLAPARWLQLSCTPDKGVTWAQLIRDKSELSEPDRTLLFLQKLKRLDGQRAYEKSQEGISKWLISLTPEAT